MQALPSRKGVVTRNRYTVSGNIALIELTNKDNITIATTKISLCDLNAVLNGGRWYCGAKTPQNRLQYVSRSYRKDGKMSVERLHRFLTGNVKGMVVDHINGDSLDNRRENLRVTTASVNQRNRHVPCTNKTGRHNINKVSTNNFRVRFTVSGVTTERKFTTLEEAEKWAEEQRPKFHTNA